MRCPQCVNHNNDRYQPPPAIEDVERIPIGVVINDDGTRIPVDYVVWQHYRCTVCDHRWKNRVDGGPV